MFVSQRNTGSVRNGKRARSHYNRTEDVPGDVPGARVPAGPALLLQDRGAHAQTGTALE